MIKNTEAFYARIMEYQEKRAQLVSEYENNLQKIERYKGSKGYQADLDKLMKQHSEALKSLQDEYKTRLNTILDGMEEMAKKRKIEAPTNEQLNLIHMLSMREKVTAEELDRVAEMVNGNSVALGVIQELARKSGVRRNYISMRPDMSTDQAVYTLGNIRIWLRDWIEYDTGRAGRLANKYHSDLYGGEVRILPKRPLFTDIDSVFKELGGMDHDEFQRFRATVDEAAG